GLVLALREGLDPAGLRRPLERLRVEQLPAEQPAAEPRQLELQRLELQRLEAPPAAEQQLQDPQAEAQQQHRTGSIKT
ncbi:MAG: hypothetical protein ACKN89_07705, partial [Cyanobium sp.]